MKQHRTGKSAHIKVQKLTSPSFTQFHRQIIPGGANIEWLQCGYNAALCGHTPVNYASLRAPSSLISAPTLPQNSETIEQQTLFAPCEGEIRRPEDAGAEPLVHPVARLPPLFVMISGRLLCGEFIPRVHHFGGVHKSNERNDSSGIEIESASENTLSNFGNFS